MAFYECDFVGALGSADAGMFKVVNQVLQWLGSSKSIELLFNETRRVSSENLARTIEQFGLCCGGLMESTFGCAA